MAISVWLANGVPVRIDHDGIRYRVNDTPTRLGGEDWWHPALTHPPDPWRGWRFQAVDRAGRARVFDIGQVGDGWRLLRVYD